MSLTSHSERGWGRDGERLRCRRWGSDGVASKKEDVVDWCSGLGVGVSDDCSVISTRADCWRALAAPSSPCWLPYSPAASNGTVDGCSEVVEVVVLSTDCDTAFW